MSDQKDDFFTIKAPSQGLYKEKGSKFLAYIYPVRDIENINDSLQILKNEHPKARHICYAYRLGVNGDSFRIVDDGEPSGTAGRPIYNELLSAEITDVLLAVVRYFGGTKLGASGLIRAYKESSNDAIQNAEIVKKYILKRAKVIFSSSHLGKVYNSIKHLNLEISNQRLGMENYIEIQIRKSEYEQKIDQLMAHFHDKSIDHIQHESFKPLIQIEAYE